MNLTDSKNLLNSLVEHNIRKGILDSDYKRDTLIIEGLETQILSMGKEKELLQGTWSVLRELLDKFSAESLTLLKQLLNKGIQSIFTDRDYEIRIEVTDNKSKKMKIILLEQTENGLVEIDMGSGALLLQGGGVLVVVSFILQVFLLNMYNKRKLICIDEGFTQISSVYVENFFRFMKYLHTDMGFTFVMVNHDQRFIPYFDKVYEVSMGKIKLK